MCAAAMMTRPVVAWAGADRLAVVAGAGPFHADPGDQEDLVVHGQAEQDRREHQHWQGTIRPASPWPRLSNRSPQPEPARRAPFRAVSQTSRNTTAGLLCGATRYIPLCPNLTLRHFGRRS